MQDKTRRGLNEIPLSAVIWLITGFSVVSRFFFCAGNRTVKITLIQTGRESILWYAETWDLAGIYGYDVFYNRTSYEIAYRIYEEADKIVVVIMAGTRENFYNELKRYLD